MTKDDQERVVRVLARVFVLTSQAIGVDPNQNRAELAFSAPKRYAKQGLMQMHSLQKSTPEIDYLIGQALDEISMEEFEVFPDNVDVELRLVWWAEYCAAITRYGTQPDAIAAQPDSIAAQGPVMERNASPKRKHMMGRITKSRRKSLEQMCDVEFDVRVMLLKLSAPEDVPGDYQNSCIPYWGCFCEETATNCPGVLLDAAEVLAGNDKENADSIMRLACDMIDYYRMNSENK